ncbi:MAG: DNA polymerase I [Alphaproteobacteria bacterium MarineAlpha9_Bin2]|nr:MAG: DNA polymerase I [Alphaproteobacteria bacterium MarineAlpha9_Bin2]
MIKGKKDSKGLLTLVDGSAFIFRAYYALPPLTRSDGMPINAVLGYCNMLWRLITDNKSDILLVIFDTARKSFRNNIYSEYKANRGEPPDDLKPQFSLVRDATEAFNIFYVEKSGYEADDIIATYATKANSENWNVQIISSDKDLMQLVHDNIYMYDPMKMSVIGEEEVYKKFGVKPNRVRDVQALAGDSIDNIPGVPGIGIKTAAELINEYGDLENLLQNASQIKQPKRRESVIDYSDMARLSMKLVSLDTNIDEIRDFKEFMRKDIDLKKLEKFLSLQGFNSLLSRLPNQENLSDKRSSYVVLPNDKIQKDNKKSIKIDYKLITEENEFLDFVDEIIEKGIVSVDTETTSLNAMEAELVGVALCIEPGKAVYVPLQHKSKDENNVITCPKQLDLNFVLGKLKPILEDEGIIKIGQNIKYDMTILHRSAKINISPIHDTMVMSFVLDAGKEIGHGMDSLSKTHLNISPISYSEITGSGKEKISFEFVKLNDALNYSAEDADITLRLYHLFRKRLLKEKMLSVYEDIERPLPAIVSEIERKGVVLNKLYLKDLSLLFEKKMKPIEQLIFNTADEEFNIASPKQLGEILFYKLGLKGGRKNKSGLYSTAAEILEKLSEEGHEIASLVLNWRGLQKLKNTYSDALQNQINKNSGRVHTQFNLTGAMTGRFSSSNPNLQNIPIRTEDGRAIRKAFIIPEGSKMISFDYSQIELRLLAEVARIDSLKEAFIEGIDIHELTASQVFSVTTEKVTSEMRREAKAINFGIIYGLSAHGLSKQLNISRTQAKEYIDSYFRQYPGIKNYMEDTKEYARKFGFVKTLFGRKCFISHINDKNLIRRAYAERQAINAPLQGAAADIIKRAMRRIYWSINKLNFKSSMILQVHDELVLESPEEEVEKIVPVIKEIMISAPKPLYSMQIPLEVDVGIGSNWDEAH